ncbi:nucleoside recognition domain-containing protein [Desulforudis sp. DRI-14]|uniref:nucleoside recognition domain-containing protein n=1 Tax=Desulforudis sp. DRI-14 TaxID=3459793 RepID=UPI003BD6012D
MKAATADKEESLRYLKALAEAARLDPAAHDRIVGSIYSEAERIAGAVVHRTRPKRDWDRRIDDILTSRWLGFPIMFLLLGAAFWLTITGANYPSRLLAAVLFWGQEQLAVLLGWLGAPSWLKEIVVDGMYRSLAWVVSVMLPPMAIFFPIFTLLEDLGYLPRVAFNLDRFFRMAGTHGKQALTMAMGFGCNAAGVVACRIIDSPRERLIARLTNVFVPCNGRFPTLITLAAVLAAGLGVSAYQTVFATAAVAGLVIAGIAVTLFVSWLLSRTLLRGVPSSFTLELPPYRRPQVVQILARSFIDRTLFVLARAVTVAAPAGALIWLLANIDLNGQSIIQHMATWLDPFARQIGLDGFILVAFILGLPANEIVLPILCMCYLSAGSMVELDSLSAIHRLFVVEHGWTWVTALCVMLFSLLHFPCGTTLYTIQKENGNWKWTFLAAAIPTLTAITVCFTVARTARILGLG